MKRKQRLSLALELGRRSRTGDSKRMKLWAEQRIVNNRHSEYLDFPGFTKSTIAVAFSHDGHLFASTHGDHTVKITEFTGGRLLQTLRGHPRTPWTVKYHPRDSRIVASGCLGGKVMVWNHISGKCLYSAGLEHAIISLSFHPSGEIIAMASGQSVYLWDYHNRGLPHKEWSHEHTLRCVRFAPDGLSLIVGAANNSTVKRNNQQQAMPVDVTFKLLLWDFRLDRALSQPLDEHVLSKPRVILDRALLYNDGGFDISSCGRFLCACAELWRVIGEPVPGGHPPPPHVDPPPPKNPSGAGTEARAGSGSGSGTGAEAGAGAGVGKGIR
ncbi:unnamed protein product, partial [Discosporangium mesarthrocarpum]